MLKHLDCLFARYPLFRYIPVLLLLACVFRTSAIPGTGMTWLVPPYDKLMHAGVYACLGVFFCFWFKNPRWNAKPFLYAFLAVILCVAFGALDEFHQSFTPGRSVSLGDVCADFVGGLIGSILYLIIQPWKRFRIFREK